MSSAHPTPDAPVRVDVLTERELEVIHLIARGFETPELAARLFISEHTVRAHVRNAMGKLDARTRAHLVALVLCPQLESR